MPRTNRHFLPGHVWHITHPCSNSSNRFRRSTASLRSSRGSVRSRRSNRSIALLRSKRLGNSFETSKCSNNGRLGIRRDICYSGGICSWGYLYPSLVSTYQTCVECRRRWWFLSTPETAGDALSTAVSYHRRQIRAWLSPGSERPGRQRRGCTST